MAYKDGTWVYPLVVDWVADLNSSLQSVVKKGSGLCSQNDWRSLFFNYQLPILSLQMI